MKLLSTLSLLAIALFLLPFQANAQQDLAEVQHVSPVRAKLMANQGTLLLDLRSAEEVAAKSYDVAKQINIPLADLEARLSELPKDEPIILACRIGNKSAQAAAILAENGFTNLINLDGGIEAWEARNLTVVEAGTKAKKSCCAGGGAKAEGKGCGSKAEGQAAASCGSKAEGQAAKSCGSKAEGQAAAGKACCAGKASGTK